MNCSSVRRYLSAYRDGALSKDARWHIRRHVKECDACRERLESLESVVAALGGICAPPAPDRVWERIRDSLEARPVARPARLERLRPALSAAAGFLVATGALFAVRRAPPDFENLHAPTREERVIDEIDYDVWYLDGRRVVRDRAPLLDRSGRDPLEELLDERTKEEER